MDIDPVNDGHMLIIPKKHKVDLDELSINEFTRVMEISRLLVKTLKQSFELDGYSIIQNGGQFNDIGHYHMHVFPRYKDDGFGWKFNDIEPKEIKEMGRKMKEKLDTFIYLSFPISGCQKPRTCDVGTVKETQLIGLSYFWF